MDPDSRKFEPVADTTPPEWAQFEIGELIALKGWWWKVERCSGGELILVVQDPTRGGIKRGVTAARAAGEGGGDD